MSIPKPLVQLNQSFIILTVGAGLLFYPALLLLPFINGVYTLISRKNPVIMLGKNFLNKPLNQYQAEDKDQQLFNQWIATICIGLSMLFIFTGWSVIGTIFGIMVIAAAGTALLGYCIGCTIRYRYMMWKYKRKHA
ncbi:DUF4395 domain-containing protein [Halobacillus massiliensis]|uniref:DUF4395 domain-containing protein n=1 Tax=Halobacillus massiliensis TaxID=1926286 RepID=UPI0009E1E2E0|nr:DUF4395 domain-containing protein [Halobacillus massiliensis]